VCRVFFIFKESFPGFARMRFSHEDWISLKGEGQYNTRFVVVIVMPPTLICRNFSTEFNMTA